MRRLIGLIGVLILFGGCAFTFMLPMGLLQNTSIWNIVESTLCDAEQILSLTASDTGLPQTQTLNYYCIDNDGITQKTVGDSITIIVSVVVLISLFGGLGLMLAAVSLDDISINIQRDTTSNTLLSKLTELKQAYDNKLITRREYEERHQQVMNAFTKDG